MASPRVKPTCSNCFLPFHHSRLNGRKDKLMSMLGFFPVRCHRCCVRVYLRDPQFAPRQKPVAAAVTAPEPSSRPIEIQKPLTPTRQARSQPVSKLELL